MKLADVHGKEVSYLTAVPGEYVANSAFDRWTYTVDLSPRKEPSAAAHISWISGGNGLLMFGDILPLVGEGRNVSGKVVIKLPEGWRQLENRTDDTLESNDIFSEVASVGKDVRYRTVHAGGTAISIRTAGNWLFTTDEIANFAQTIYAGTADAFGAAASAKVFVNIFRFPQNLPHGQWQAETRGRNITIISSDMAFKTQSLQRLHEQLRHEMFHLWIPNAVNLSGRYDWFYEGFALYFSLKLAVALNQIRFEDFLDTLSRAHAIDSRQGSRRSLTDISNSRWNGNDTYLYARGMFAAFLCDLEILSGSKTKRSVNDLLGEVYKSFRAPAVRTDGTAAVLSAMRTRPELLPIVDKYVEGPARFDVGPELANAGLEISSGLRVIARLNGKQKDLLDALGYNNWRRLSPAR